MNDFINDLFVDTSKATGVNIVDTENNYVINEAIILDMLDGDKNKLKAFFESIGQYGARDKILSESANLDCCISTLGDNKCANCASVLAVAKESGSKDYELYIKAILLMKQCMENMKSQFGDIAEKRLAVQKAEVEANPRVIDAVEACCK